MGKKVYSYDVRAAMTKTKPQHTPGPRTVRKKKCRPHHVGCNPLLCIEEAHMQAAINNDWLHIQSLPNGKGRVFKWEVR